MEVEVTNPWTGTIDYRYRYQDMDTVERVLAASAAAFPEWSDLGIDRRAVYLEKVAGLLDGAKHMRHVVIESNSGNRRSLGRKCLRIERPLLPARRETCAQTVAWKVNSNASMPEFCEMRDDLRPSARIVPSTVDQHESGL